MACQNNFLLFLILVPYCISKTSACISESVEEIGGKQKEAKLEIFMKHFNKFVQLNEVLDLPTSFDFKSGRSVANVTGIHFSGFKTVRNNLVVNRENNEMAISMIAKNFKIIMDSITVTEQHSEFFLQNMEIFLNNSNFLIIGTYDFTKNQIKEIDASFIDDSDKISYQIIHDNGKPENVSFVNVINLYFEDFKQDILKEIKNFFNEVLALIDDI